MFSILAPIHTVLSTFATSSCDTTKTFFGMPVWYKYLNVSTGADGQCDFTHFFYNSHNQFSFNSILLVGLAILDDLLVLAGIVAVIFVIYGATQYILSQGNPDRTKAAQSTIVNALIGMAIALVAVVLVNFIGTSLGG